MAFSSSDTLSFTLVTHPALSHQARLSGMSCGCSLLQYNRVFYCFRGKNSMSSCSPATLPRADCSQSGSQLWGCREMLTVPLCCSTAFSMSGHRSETSYLGSIKLWAPPRWGLDHFSVKAEICWFQNLLMPEKKAWEIHRLPSQGKGSLWSKKTWNISSHPWSKWKRSIPGGSK